MQDHCGCSSQNSSCTQLHPIWRSHLLMECNFAFNAIRTGDLKRCLLHELWHSIISIGANKAHLPLFASIPSLNYIRSVFVSITRAHKTSLPFDRTHPPEDAARRQQLTGQVRRKMAIIRKSYFILCVP